MERGERSMVFRVKVCKHRANRKIRVSLGKKAAKSADCGAHLAPAAQLPVDNVTIYSSFPIFNTGSNVRHKVERIQCTRRALPTTE